MDSAYPACRHDYLTVRFIDDKKKLENKKKR